MRKCLWGLAALVLAIGLAQPSVADVTGLVIAKVPQEFKAGLAKLPAGEYEVEASDANQTTLVLRNTATGKAEIVPYITRLAQRGASENALVFDKIGEELTLSEVHVVGADGYYVAAVSGKHSHVTVKAAKKG